MVVEQNPVSAVVFIYETRPKSHENPAELKCNTVGTAKRAAESDIDPKNAKARASVRPSAELCRSLLIALFVFNLIYCQRRVSGGYRLLRNFV